ncbi:eukaryotic translation initiation factor 2 subunit beta isoform X1 [Brassica napus]|uniref:eukaryotic translation initiation factor 2 subunit beta isoform X1 n=1 Tax=Brassica napus TaxID=3708 RepID=UPI00207A06BC|nr:eukaryotic translation initiation factor 2 subunit beta isoform X1 [Brassica napus]
MDLQQEQEACWKLELDKVTKLDPSKKKKKKKKKLFIREDATYDSEPDYGYAELLSRVFDMLREEEVSTERPRTVMMRRPQLLAQGTQITVCLDFAHLCTTIHRKPGHVIKFLLGQMETKGWLNKQHQLEMKGLVSSQHFQAVFQRYIDAFVICSCCKSPDTALAEDNGISTLSCEMCGLVASINEPNPL